MQKRLRKLTSSKCGMERKNGGMFENICTSSQGVSFKNDIFLEGELIHLCESFCSQLFECIFENTSGEEHNSFAMVN